MVSGGPAVGGAAYHERCARNGTAPRGTGGVMRMGNGGAPHAGVRAVGREPGAPAGGADFTERGISA